MGDRSQIEWTDATWNPTRGCSKVSEGCRNCYAMRQAIRHSGPGGSYEGLAHNVPGKGPQWTGEIRLVEEALELPLRWRAPRRVFVDSMSDLFHEGVPTEFIAHAFAVMLVAEQHTFQILTKRPERAVECLTALHGFRDTVYWFATGLAAQRGLDTSDPLWPWNRYSEGWPLPNVWLGTSVEDQAAADERIPHLLRAPAAVRFLSCEPLLGPVQLRQSWRDYLEGWETEAECCRRPGRDGTCCGAPDPVQVQTARIDWVIVGGESGPGARPFDVAWARSLRDDCARAGVAFFLKQLGSCARDESRPPGAQVLYLDSRKGGDPAEWPADLRVREFPQPAEVAHG